MSTPFKFHRQGIKGCAHAVSLGKRSAADIEVNPTFGDVIEYSAARNINTSVDFICRFGGIFQRGLSPGEGHTPGIFHSVTTRHMLLDLIPSPLAWSPDWRLHPFPCGAETAQSGFKIRSGHSPQTLQRCHQKNSGKGLKLFLIPPAEPRAGADQFAIFDAAPQSCKGKSVHRIAGRRRK